MFWCLYVFTSVGHPLHKWIILKQSEYTLSMAEWKMKLKNLIKWFFCLNSIQSNYTSQNSSHRRRLESEFPKFGQMMSNRHRRDTNSNPDDQQCPKNKPIIKKAFTRCSSSTNSCIVQCSNNHQFTNGKTSVKLLCKAGAWILEGFEKNDKPVCEREYQSDYHGFSIENL